MLNALTKRISTKLLLTYLFIGLITGWLSFYPRPMKVAAAFELQQKVWENFQEQGKAGRSEDLLVKIHGPRILFPALMQVPMALGLDGERAFSLLRLVSIIIAYVLFHIFLREWFSEELAFCGTLFMAATVPLTFNGYFEIPTDFVEIIVFTLGLWAIYRENYFWLCPVVVVGTLNRESAAVLPFFLFFRLFSLKRFNWLLPVFASGLCWLLPLIALRWWTGTMEAHGYGYSVRHNALGLWRLLTDPHPYNNYLFWLYLFGTFWFLPYTGWKRQPPFFKSLLISLPIVVVVYYLTAGAFDEPREIVNYYPLLVPASLISLFPDSQYKKPESDAAPT